MHVFGVFSTMNSTYRRTQCIPVCFPQLSGRFFCCTQKFFQNFFPEPPSEESMRSGTEGKPAGSVVLELLLRPGAGSWEPSDVTSCVFPTFSLLFFQYLVQTLILRFFIAVKVIPSLFNSMQKCLKFARTPCSMFSLSRNSNSLLYIVWLRLESTVICLCFLVYSESYCNSPGP